MTYVDLTITYQIPLSAEAWSTNEGGTSCGTADSRLSMANVLTNSVKFYSGSNESNTARADYYKPGGTITKTAEVVDAEEGIYKYTIYFINYHPTSNGGSYWMSLNEISKLILTDSYDSSLEYYYDEAKRYQLGLELYRYQVEKGTGTYSPSQVTWISFSDGDGDGNLEGAVTETKGTDSNALTISFSKVKGGYSTDSKKATKNLQDFLKSDNIKYQIFKFTYYMKVTEDAKKKATVSTLKLSNTAQISTDHTTTTPHITNFSTATVSYATNVLTKDVEQDGAILTYTVTLNPNGMTMNNGAPMTVVDELAENLELVFTNNTGKFEDAVTIYTDVDKTTKLVYGTGANQWSAALEGKTLKITVPDNTPCYIVFNCRVTTAGTSSNISNSVYIDGKMEEVTGEKSYDFTKVDTQGELTTETEQFKILKTDEAEKGLPEATFYLYCASSSAQITGRPEGLSAEAWQITLQSGSSSRTWYWIGQYTSDEDGYVTISQYAVTKDGTVKYNILTNGYQYMLREAVPPDGYAAVEDIYFTYSSKEYVDSETTPTSKKNTTYFYFYRDSTLDNVQMTVIDPIEASYELPSTGGTGVTLFYGVGAALMVAVGCIAVALAFDRRKPRRS